MSTVAVQRALPASAITQNLYDYVDELYDKIGKRAFSLFENNGRIHGRDLSDWLRAEAEFLAPVPLEISETETELAVRAEVPGFNEKELEILAEPGRLFIKGKNERKTEEKKRKTLYSEIAANEIFRSVALPSEIDPDKVTAVLKNGVLEVSMHKAKPAKKVSVMPKAA